MPTYNGNGFYLLMAREFHLSDCYNYPSVSMVVTIYR